MSNAPAIQLPNLPRPKAGLMKLLTLADLATLRDPEWQVDGMIPAGGLVVVYGPPGAGKSFFVLGLVLSVAYGAPFYRKPVKSGPVLYVAAEGSGGLKARVDAWRTANVVPADAPAYFYPDVVNLLESQAINALIEALQGFPELPSLIVFDTFARCMLGGDENSARDVGQAIASADRIRKETGAAVILVHHTSKAGEVERGSTALRGAADTMIHVKGEDGQITVACDKQKEAEPFARLALKLRTVAKSCVLSTITGAENQSTTITKFESTALEVLSNAFLEDGAAATPWLKASKLADVTFWRTRTSLVRKGYVQKVGSKYTLTAKGCSAVAINYQGTIKALSDSETAQLSALSRPYKGDSADSAGGEVQDAEPCEAQPEEELWL